MHKTFFLSYKRRINDKLVPYVMILDADTKEVLKEGPEASLRKQVEGASKAIGRRHTSVGAAGAAPRRAVKLDLEAYARTLRSRGHDVEVKNGSIINKYTPPIEGIIYAFMRGERCDFPGYVQWKERYDREIGSLEADCSNCELTKVKNRLSKALREYLSRLEADSMLSDAKNRTVAAQ